MKILIGLLCFVVLTGCAGIRTWTLEMSQEDLANAVVSRQIADNLMSTWALNSGLLQCGFEDHMPVSMLKRLQKVDGMVKQANKWEQADFDRGCFLGARGDLTYAQLKALYEKVLPIVVKMVGG